jgi:hypothetical protein
MNVRAYLVTFAVFALALAGCKGDPSSPDVGELMTPSDAFVIPERERVVVEAAAKNGDVASVKRLIAHYDALSGYDELASKWRAVARELGDSDQLYYYAASTFVDAGHEADAVKRHAMLVDALDAARRSDASSTNASAQKLIREVKLALKEEP